MNQSQRIIEALKEGFWLTIKNASKRGSFRIEVVANLGDKPKVSKIVGSESEAQEFITKMRKEHTIKAIKNISTLVLK